MSPDKTDKAYSSHQEETEYYKFLAEGLLDFALYSVSDKGIVQNWSKGAERLMGYTGEEVIGKHFSMFYEPADRDRKYPDYELSEAHRAGRFEGAGWRLRKDGSRVWVDVLIAGLRDEKGKLKGFIKVVRDASERKKAEDTIDQQKKDLLELSTPVITLWKGILALPIIGTLDSGRSQVIMERLLHGLSSSGCTIAILDISGVPTVDTVVAQRLMKTVEAARLMGAQCIISGIRPEIAQTMVQLGIDMTTVRTKSNMSRALQEALSMLNLKVINTAGANGKGG